MKNTDTRRFRRRTDGVVFRIVVQARSPYGPVELVSTDGSSEVIHTTNDKLQIMFEFFQDRTMIHSMKLKKSTQKTELPPEDLEEWRWYDTVISDRALLLAIRYPTFEDDEQKPFHLYDKTNHIIYEIVVGSNAYIESETVARYPYRLEETSELSQVRLFDPEHGCVIPWPPKPYPNVEEYLAARKEFEHLQELRELEAEEDKLKLSLDAVVNKKAALLSKKK